MKRPRGSNHARKDNSFYSSYSLLIGGRTDEVWMKDPTSFRSDLAKHVEQSHPEVSPSLNDAPPSALNGVGSGFFHNSRSLMTIDVYADIACPWCYVGRARLKDALAQRSDLGVTLRWRPFQLQPDLPADGADFRTVLERKFGSWTRAERMFDRIREMGGEEGLTFNFDAIEVAPNTADAHRLVLWAQSKTTSSLSPGAEDEDGPVGADAMATTLFRAYFTDGRNVSDRAVLADCAAEAGFDADEARAMLGSDAHADAVRESQQQAQRRGVTGVPCYVFNDEQAVTGAQPTDVFLEVFDAVEAESAGQS